MKNRGKEDSQAVCNVLERSIIVILSLRLVSPVENKLLLYKAILKPI